MPPDATMWYSEKSKLNYQYSYDYDKIMLASGDFKYWMIFDKDIPDAETFTSDIPGLETPNAHL